MQVCAVGSRDRAWGAQGEVRRAAGRGASALDELPPEWRVGASKRASAVRCSWRAQACVRRGSGITRRRSFGISAGSIIVRGFWRGREGEGEGESGSVEYCEDSRSEDSTDVLD